MRTEYEIAKEKVEWQKRKNGLIKKTALSLVFLGYLLVAVSYTLCRGVRYDRHYSTSVSGHQDTLMVFVESFAFPLVLAGDIVWETKCWLASKDPRYPWSKQPQTYEKLTKEERKAPDPRWAMPRRTANGGLHVASGSYIVWSNLCDAASIRIDNAGDGNIVVTAWNEKGFIEQ